MSITLPDDANEQAVSNIISAHNPNALSFSEQEAQRIQTAKIDFRALPNYATWTPQEAYDTSFNAVFSGQDAATIKSNIAAQLTDITTANVAQINVRLAAIRLLFNNAVDAIVAMRLILATAIKMLAYIRDVVIKLRG